MSDTFIQTFRDSDDFRLGIEVGMSICEFMLGYKEIQGEYASENDEQIIAAASRLGYRLVDLRPVAEGYIYLRFKRGRKPVKGKPTA